jgi:hypothetical protein
MYRRHPTADNQRPGSQPPPSTAARTGPAPSSADLIQRRRLEKAVSWSGRERFRKRASQARVGPEPAAKHKRLKMRKRNIVLSLAAAAPAVAILISSCAPAAPKVANNNLTVQCSETLTGQDVTNGGVSGTGRCALTGMLHDSGRVTDYRTQRGETAFIRRVVTGAKGTITFLITITLAGPGPGGGQPWTITSGTKTYTKLHGRGHQVVDNYTGSPATFVLKGTVSQARALN